MAGRPAVQVRGAAELRKALTSMGASAADLTAAGRAAADIVASKARVLVPVKSGALLRSIKPRANKTRSSVRAGSAGRIVPYAGPIHFGWPQRNISPQPFLYDALDARKSQVVDVYAARIEDLVRKLDRETPG